MDRPLTHSHSHLCLSLSSSVCIRQSFCSTPRVSDCLCLCLCLSLYLSVFGTSLMHNLSSILYLSLCRCVCLSLCVYLSTCVSLQFCLFLYVSSCVFVPGYLPTVLHVFLPVSLSICMRSVCPSTCMSFYCFPRKLSCIAPLGKNSQKPPSLTSSFSLNVPSDGAHSFVHSFVRSFVRSFVHSLFHSSAHSFVRFLGVDRCILMIRRRRHSPPLSLFSTSLPLPSIHPLVFLLRLPPPSCWCWGGGENSAESVPSTVLTKPISRSLAALHRPGNKRSLHGGRDPSYSDD